MCFAVFVRPMQYGLKDAKPCPQRRIHSSKWDKILASYVTPTSGFNVILKHLNVLNIEKMAISWKQSEQFRGLNISSYVTPTSRSNVISTFKKIPNSDKIAI